MPAEVDGTGYWVVPSALRKTATAWDTCRSSWDFFLTQLPVAKMSGTAMGLVGAEAHFPRDYNDAIDTIIETTKRAITQMEENYADLDGIATEYEGHDEKYYERFGYIGGEGESDASDKF